MEEIKVSENEIREAEAALAEAAEESSAVYGSQESADGGKNVSSADGGGKKKKSGGRIILGVIKTLACIAVVAALGVLVKFNLDNKHEIGLLKDKLDTAQAAEDKDGKKEKSSESDDDIEKRLEKLEELADEVREMWGEYEPDDVAAEDDVMIGGTYLIKSTTQISDAYKSGDTSALSEEDLKTLEMAKEVIDEVITDGMTDYEKEKAIYEWIHDNIRIDDGITVAIPIIGSYADNPGGVLTHKKAVCVGFATTFRLFMQMLDIDCKVVHDSYRGHSWNLVLMDDGNWYHVDNYIDNGSTLYRNFNMNDEAALAGHEWNQDFFPAAEGYEYSYAYQNAVPFKSIDEAVQKAYEIYNSGKSGSVYFKVEGPQTADYVYALEYADSVIADRIWQFDDGSDCYTESSEMWIDDEICIVGLHFDFYDYEEDNAYYYGEDEAEGLYADAENAVNTIFGR